MGMGIRDHQLGLCWGVLYPGKMRGHSHHGPPHSCPAPLGSPGCSLTPTQPSLLSTISYLSIKHSLTPPLLCLGSFLSLLSCCHSILGDLTAR